jgi:hypothetical protein
VTATWRFGKMEIFSTLTIMNSVPYKKIKSQGVTEKALQLPRHPSCAIQGKTLLDRWEPE